MAQHLVPEGKLVLPFDLGHRQQTVDQLLMIRIEGVRRRVFVFDDVSSLEQPRSVHRKEPSRNVAEDSRRAADDPEDDFASPIRGGAEAAKHFADQFTMVPLLSLDDADAFALGKIADAVPMSAVGVAGGQLT